jgi:hypothetical protein
LLDAALLCAVAVATSASPADAAVPEAGAKFGNHDHATPGDGWHVELTVSSDPRRVRQLVLHDERCEATVLTSNVAISAEGVIDSAKPFTSRGHSGTWRLPGSRTRTTSKAASSSTRRTATGRRVPSPRTPPAITRAAPATTTAISTALLSASIRT